METFHPVVNFFVLSFMFVALAAGLMGIYATPTALAIYLHKRNKGLIMIVNLGLGWSVLGWFVALGMVMIPDKSKGRLHTRQDTLTNIPAPRIWHPGKVLANNAAKLPKIRQLGNR